MADNEIVTAARDAAEKAKAAAASIEAARARRWQIGRIGPIGLGLGVGIGSAAIAAAVLYARSGRDDA